jgi:hypothetical protein
MGLAPKSVPQTGLPGFDEFLELELGVSDFAGVWDRTKSRFKAVQSRKWVVFRVVREKAWVDEKAGTRSLPGQHLAVIALARGANIPAGEDKVAVAGNMHVALVKCRNA